MTLLKSSGRLSDSFSNFVCAKHCLVYSDVLLETMRNLLKTILFAFIAIFFIGCHTTPRDARQVARDALENARIQLDSGNKIDAMRLFKEAEQKAADEGFGDNYAERAKVMTFWGDYYQFHRQFDSAEVYLIRAMDYAERSGSVDAKRCALSAFHVKCFNAKEYKKSGDYLLQYFQTYPPDPSDSVLMYYYHNMGNVYFKMGNMDSTTYYYGRLEEILTSSEPDCSAQNESAWY